MAGALIARPAVWERNDTDLLTDFLASHNNTAFGMLVARHERMVQRTCGRILRHWHDVEDASQNILVVLLRKAAELVLDSRKTIGGWLHGVAVQEASNVKRGRIRRRGHEDCWDLDRLVYLSRAICLSEPVDALAAEEMAAIIDEEIERLPRQYRDVFVACCLEERSRTEAARELGWKPGSVATRYKRACQLLRQRLKQHGIGRDGE